MVTLCLVVNKIPGTCHLLWHALLNNSHSVTSPSIHDWLSEQQWHRSKVKQWIPARLVKQIKASVAQSCSRGIHRVEASQISSEVADKPCLG